MSLPEVPGVLDVAQVHCTAAGIAEWQLPNGMIPWFPGGHADPWNHVEAAMALAATGHLDEAEAAYRWLADTQLPNGAWHQYYTAEGIEDHKHDANVIAYVATGAWHHWLMTRDRGFLEAMWPVVEPAIDFVLDLQTTRGEILWARHADGTPWSFALLAGSASISHSLRCAIAIAEELGHERPDWELSLAYLAHTVRTRPDGSFAPKDRWAMDWYYPVLSGTVDGGDAIPHLGGRYDEFVMDGLGVRCVSNRPWVTVAETCECAIAHLFAGARLAAEQMFSWIQAMRCDDGRYVTGLVHPEGVTFPNGERTTYSAAAVVLTADALSGASPASGLFTEHTGLPDIISTRAPVHESD